MSFQHERYIQNITTGVNCPNGNTSVTVQINVPTRIFWDKSGRNLYIFPEKIGMGHLYMLQTFVQHQNAYGILILMASVQNENKCSCSNKSAISILISFNKSGKN